MYYHSISVTTIPGKRFQGIEHLKKMATWVQETYGVRTEVLGNMSGKIYRNHMITRYDSLAQMEDTLSKIINDPDWTEWFNEGMELMAWADAEQATFQVF